MNAELMPSGHQTSRQRDNKVENPTTGIKIQGIVVTTIKSMDMFLRTILKHISKVTTKGG